MEQSSQVREALVSQLENEYGKLVYTYTCHLKQAKVSGLVGTIVSWTDITLTAITTGSLLGLLFTDQKVLAIISAICAALALMINLYQKEAKITEKATEHLAFAQKLWLPREKYISLLTDAPILDNTEIHIQRDKLQETLNDIYSREPMTHGIAYKMTQRALKDNEEQFFSRDELNRMLPESLRR